MPPLAAYGRTAVPRRGGARRGAAARGSGLGLRLGALGGDLGVDIGHVQRLHALDDLGQCCRRQRAGLGSRAMRRCKSSS